jgi:hypothetical protein
VAVNLLTRIAAKVFSHFFLVPPTRSVRSATFLAAMDPEGMHLGNAKTGAIFIKNFFADFKAVLGKGHVIKDFKKCDFEAIRKHLNEQKIIRKAITDEERKANKDDRNQASYKYGFAIVDGHLEKVGNYNMVRLLQPDFRFRRSLFSNIGSSLFFLQLCVLLSAFIGTTRYLSRTWSASQNGKNQATSLAGTSLPELVRVLCHPSLRGAWTRLGRCSP